MIQCCHTISSWLTDAVPPPSTARSTRRFFNRSRGPDAAGRAAAERGRSGAPVRRLAHHGCACAARPADGGPRRAARGVGDVRRAGARGPTGRWRLAWWCRTSATSRCSRRSTAGCWKRPRRSRTRCVWGTGAGDRGHARGRSLAGSASSTSRGAWTASSSRRSSCTPIKDTVNRRIAEAFAAARIPVVLIDRIHRAVSAARRATIWSASTTAVPARSSPSHLLDRGCTRPVSSGCPARPPASMDAEAGFREALARARADGAARPRPARGSRRTLRLRRRAHARRPRRHRLRQRSHGRRADAHAARARPPFLARCGWCGIDDVEYAALLPVPLTTLRQPCREIGVAAMRRWWIAGRQPDLPPRDILLHGQLIVRESSGEAPRGDSPQMASDQEQSPARLAREDVGDERPGA